MFQHPGKKRTRKFEQHIIMPRGKHLSLGCLKAVRAAYDEAISEKKERPGALESVGADKLMGNIPFKVGRSALTKVVKHFKNGGTAKEY